MIVFFFVVLFWDGGSTEVFPQNMFGRKVREWRGVGGARTGSPPAPLSHHQWVYLKKVVKMEREGEKEERPRLFSPPLISLFSKVFLAAPLCFHSSFYRAGVETRCGCCSSAVAVAVAQQNVKQNKVQQQQRQLVSEASAQVFFFLLFSRA